MLYAVLLLPNVTRLVAVWSLTHTRVLPYLLSFLPSAVRPGHPSTLNAFVCSFVCQGPDAAEIIQGLAVAMKAGATKAHFDATIGVHPSAAEEFVTMREPHSRYVRGVRQ